MQKNHIFFWVIALMSFLPFSNFAQVVTGKVIQNNAQGTKEALVGATVVWLGTQHATTTNPDGTFQIAKHTNQAAKLVISFVGFKADTVTVAENTTDLGEITLQNQSELDEVEVRFKVKSTLTDDLSPLKANIITKKELAKAACCNLSESFETSPAVDVSFTDAITGAKQIEMLGLSGVYTQLTTENMPSVRGLASNFGLNYIPGSWIQGIQVSKGVGSVVNGYESIAGQINVELKNPLSTEKEKEKFFLNLYFNQAARSEANINFTNRISPTWATTTLLHGSFLPLKTDMNHDGFMDMPTYEQVNLVNRWQFQTEKGWEGQFGVKILYDNKLGGQVDDKSHIEHTDSAHKEYPTYRFGMTTKRIEAWTKTGYVWQDKPYKSTGLQISANHHDVDATFGLNTYTGKQQTLYLNWIFQTIIANTNHKIKFGVSNLLDNYNEHYKGNLVLGTPTNKIESNHAQFNRTENALGAFVEYQYSIFEKFDAVAGLRADYHNLFGAFVTPRLHLRYAPTENTILRAGFGRGQRTANIFMENAAILASSRQIVLPAEQTGSRNAAYGLQPEIAWNYGINLTQNFRWRYRDGSIAVDFYHTAFQNQDVTDLDKNPQQLLMYNLDGQSYSNSLQVELNYELFDNFDVKAAYRFLDVQTTFHGNLLQKPLIAPHRFFINLAYKTENNWTFDYTLQWFSSKRLPNTQSNPEAYRREAYSPNYFISNAQVAKTFKNVDVYLGAENLLDFRQDNPIIAASTPYSHYFDSSLVWAPVFGRMVYVGMRWKL